MQMAITEREEEGEFDERKERGFINLPRKHNIIIINMSRT
jgi:hypothetical protein